jgi:hypothetical protein
MRTFLLRLLSLARARGRDAASGGRRLEAAQTIGGLNSAILAGNHGGAVGGVVCA